MDINERALMMHGKWNGKLEITPKCRVNTRAVQISEEMKLAAAEAIAGLVEADDLSDDNIMPQPFDPRLSRVVSNAVKAHIRDGNL